MKNYIKDNHAGIKYVGIKHVLKYTWVEELYKVSSIHMEAKQIQKGRHNQ